MGQNSEVSERFMVMDFSFVVLDKNDKPGKSTELAALNKTDTVSQNHGAPSLQSPTC